MEQPQSPYDFNDQSAEYSPSIYSEFDKSVSPDRPGTPSSFECYITLRGGRSSATELSRFCLQHIKCERLTDGQKYTMAIAEASFLRAENAWLRRIRKSSMALFEDTVQPTSTLLAEGANTIHDALVQFYFTFGAISQLITQDREVASSYIKTTLDELDQNELEPAFKLCREGLRKIQNASRAVQKGEETFSKQLSEWNKSYAKFFEIDYKDTAEVDACSSK